MAEIDRLDGEIGEKIELRNEVGDNLQREQRRLESVRQAAGRLEEDVEGIRGAVGRLEVAIADLARKLAPRSARMTTRALKRDLAALERDYVEDDDRSPKARAAEAQRAARGLNANRGDEAPRRSWGQSR